MSRVLNQVATYWAPTGENLYGVNSFASPIAITCHWEDRTDLVRNPKGEEFTTSAVVFVDRVLVSGGFLCKGDFTVISDPFLTGAKEIRGFTQIPDLRNVDTTRKALL